jgi:chromosome segregation ATPase
MKTEKANIRNVDRQIEAEAKRMATHTIERRERARAKLEETKKTIEDVEARLKSLEDQVREKGEAANDARSEAERVQTSLNQAKSRVQECEAQIRVAKDSEKNVLAPYGNSMEVVIKEVQNMRWHGQKPLGPLGRFVKLKDPQWADALRVNLSGTMVSWAITDARDRAPLKSLLERCGKYAS